MKNKKSGNVIVLVMIIGMVGAILAAISLTAALSMNQRNINIISEKQTYLAARSAAELVADKLSGRTVDEELPFFGRGYKVITAPGFLGDSADSMNVGVEVTGLPQGAPAITLTIKPYKMSFEIEGEGGEGGSAESDNGLIWFTKDNIQPGDTVQLKIQWTNDKPYKQSQIFAIPIPNGWEFNSGTVLFGVFFIETPKVQPGSTYTLTIPVKVPSDASGSYTISVYTDKIILPIYNYDSITVEIGGSGGGGGGDTEKVEYDLVDIFIEATATRGDETFTRTIRMRNYEGVDYSFVDPPQGVTDYTSFFGVTAGPLYVWKYE